jgi:hypothetical protein
LRHAHALEHLAGDQCNREEGQALARYRLGTQNIGLRVFFVMSVMKSSLLNRTREPGIFHSLPACPASQAFTASSAGAAKP